MKFPFFSYFSPTGFSECKYDASPVPSKTPSAVSSTCFPKMLSYLISPPLIVQELQELLQGEGTLVHSDTFL